MLRVSDGDSTWSIQHVDRNINRNRLLKVRLIADRSINRSKVKPLVDGIVEVALVPNTMVVPDAVRLVAEILVRMIVDWSVVRTMEPRSVVGFVVEWSKGIVVGHDNIWCKEGCWSKVGRSADKIVNLRQNRRRIVKL